MTYLYYPGTKRAFRWPANRGDVRNWRPAPGWSAFADLTDTHPITGAALPESQWWMIETKDEGLTCRDR